MQPGVSLPHTFLGFPRPILQAAVWLRVSGDEFLTVCVPSGQGACKRNGAGWPSDQSRLLHYKEASHPNPWDLHGTTDLVSDPGLENGASAAYRILGPLVPCLAPLL